MYVHFLEHTATVRYRGTTTIELLAARGEYSSVDEDLNDAQFPYVKFADELVTFGLVNFGRHILAKDAEVELARLGLQSANVAELLTFGALRPTRYPNEYGVAALGQKWSGKIKRQGVVSIGGMQDSEIRHVHISRWLNHEWHRLCHFLVVREAYSPSW